MLLPKMSLKLLYISPFVVMYWMPILRDSKMEYGLFIFFPENEQLDFQIVQYGGNRNFI